MAYKVFVSYSSKDLDVVEKMRSVLESSMIEVFVAEHSVAPGEILTKKINLAIKNCDLFIFLWSLNSKESEWVQTELGIALAAKKTILPVLLDYNLEPPGFIKNIKYLEAHSNIEQAFSVLKSTIYNNAQKKHQVDGMVWMGLAAAFVYVLFNE